MTINENKWNLSIRLKLLPEDGLEEGLHFNNKYHKKRKLIKLINYFYNNNISINNSNNSINTNNKITII